MRVTGRDRCIKQEILDSFENIRVAIRLGRQQTLDKCL